MWTRLYDIYLSVNLSKSNLLLTKAFQLNMRVEFLKIAE